MRSEGYLDDFPQDEVAEDNFRSNSQGGHVASPARNLPRPSIRDHSRRLPQRAPLQTNWEWGDDGQLGELFETQQLIPPVETNTNTEAPVETEEGENEVIEESEITVVPGRTSTPNTEGLFNPPPSRIPVAERSLTPVSAQRRGLHQAIGGTPIPARTPEDSPAADVSVAPLMQRPRRNPAPIARLGIDG